MKEEPLTPSEEFSMLVATLLFLRKIKQKRPQWFQKLQLMSVLFADISFHDAIKLFISLNRN
jgi:hypothetical protein